MDPKLIDRYRRHIEISVWLLIIGVGIFVNLAPIESIVANRTLLNGLVLSLIVYTFFYYHLVAPRYLSITLILSSTTLYTFFVFLVIHYSGSYESVLFPLIFVPILVSSMMLGVQALLLILVLVLTFLFLEFFFFFRPGFLYPTNLWATFLEKLSSVLLVAFVSYTNAHEMMTRAQESVELTEEKAAIRELMERNEAILSSMQEGVFAVNKKGKLVLLNQAAEKMLGRKQSELLGQKYQSALPLSSEKNSSLYKSRRGDPVQKIFKNKKSIYLDNLTLKQGQNRLDVHLSLSPLTDQKSQVVGVAGVLRDVTFEKELEQMKLDFVSMAAHELRTPITSIRGYLAILKKDLESKLSKEHLTFLNRTIISSNQLVSLMENLLSVSRIERSKVTLKTAATDWIPILRKTVHEFNLAAQERGLKLKFVPPSQKLPQVMVNRLRIVEVLNNLLQNAITYTPHGRVTVSTYLDKDNKRVVTSIQDTGQGIPTESLPHIFEKFYRVSGALEQGSKGTGLGLYISKRIVEFHSGTIWVKSEPEKGSSFYFSLPTSE